MSPGLLHRLVCRINKSGDDGVALLTVILFLAVAGALTAAVSVLAVNNEQNANRDRQAAGALQTAEGGIAQAIQLMRTTPVGYFTCQEPSPNTLSSSCSTNPAGWTSSVSPMKVSSDGTTGACKPALACFAVWISTVKPYAAGSYALLRIHSTGLFGGGPAARSLAVDVKVQPAKFPIGIFANSVSTSGTFGVNHESLFSIDCINHRVFDTYTGSPPVPNSSGSSGGGGIQFAGIDAQYGIPAAAHSTKYVTQSNNGCDGGTTNSSQQANVHDSSQGWAPCNASDPYDQDSQGAVLSPSCPGYQGFTDTATGQKYPTTSAFTMDDLRAHGYRPGGLSPNEYLTLKSMAQSSGTYFTSPTASPFTALNTNAATNAVIYYDLPAGSGSQTVQITPSDIPSMYFRSYNDNTSSCLLPSLVIIVRNGNLTYNTSGGNSRTGSLVASMFVPDGSYQGQGNSSIIGTLYAQTIAAATGTQNWYLDNCFVANPPGPVMSIRVVNYREVDTQNVN